MKIQTVRIAYVGLSDIQDSASLISTHHYVRNFGYIHQGDEREVEVQKGSDWEMSKTCWGVVTTQTLIMLSVTCTCLRVHTVSIGVPVV